MREQGEASRSHFSAVVTVVLVVVVSVVLVVVVAVPVALVDDRFRGRARPLEN